MRVRKGGEEQEGGEEREEQEAPREEEEEEEARVEGERASRRGRERRGSIAGGKEGDSGMEMVGRKGDLRGGELARRRVAQ